MSGSFMTIATIAIFALYNGATIWILRKTLSSTDIKEALKEKEATAGPASATAIAEAEAKANAAIATLKDATTKATAVGAAPAETANLVNAQAAVELALQQLVTATRSTGLHGDTSYSRVAGMVGAIVLATFFWAVGNVIVVRSLNRSEADISGMLEGLSAFFISGAALFLPYGVNQLRATFDKSKG